MLAYNDPEYRRIKNWLRTNPVDCWYGCGNRATTPDHRPPLKSHRHIRGSRCCELKPACAKCNAADGARLRNALSSSAFDW